jgi:hypothetical protein
MNNTEKLMDFLLRLSAWDELEDKIEYCNIELRQLEYFIYLTNNSKTASLEEKKITTDEINELYDKIDSIFNKYTEEHFNNFKNHIFSYIESFPTDKSITYLNGILKQMKEDEDDFNYEDEDKSLEIFLNNELRKLKIKKLINE